MDPSQEKTTVSDPSTILSSIAFNGGAFVLFFLAFCILRVKWPKSYAPTTYLTEENVPKPNPLPRSLLGWILPLFQIPDNVLLYNLGLDGFMLLMFFKSMFLLFALISAVVFVLLVPVNVVNQFGGGQSIDSLGFSNVQDIHRMWAHSAVNAFISFFIIYMLRRQLKSFVSLRQLYLTSPAYRRLPESRTILLVNLPWSTRSSRNLAKTLGFQHNMVERIYMIKDLSKDKLSHLLHQRTAAIKFIEKDAMAYLKHAYHRRKAGIVDIERGERETQPLYMDARPQHTVCDENEYKRVDGIQYQQHRLRDISVAIDKQRRQLIQEAEQGGPDYTAAFITLRTQQDAQLVAQLIKSTDARAYNPCVIEVTPADVVWENLCVAIPVADAKRAVATVASAALIIFWVVPIAFAQSVSQLSNLEALLPFIKGVTSWNPTARGIVQGVLPAGAVAILVSMLPFLLAYLTKLEGQVSVTAMMLSLHRKYYWFLLFQVLFVGTVITGGISAARKIVELGETVVRSPAVVFDILGTSIPQASSFFFTYIVIFTFFNLGMELAQIQKLAVNWIIVQFFSRTPRDVYAVQATKPVQHAIIYGQSSLIFSIGLVYSTISPVVPLACCAYFGVAYFVYRHNLLYTYRNDVETGGRHLPLVANHVIVGLIIHQLTLVGLLGSRQAAGPAVLSFIVLIVTAAAKKSTFVQHFSRRRIQHLPIDIVAAANANRALSDVHGHEGRLRFLPIWDIREADEGQPGVAQSSDTVAADEQAEPERRLGVSRYERLMVPPVRLVRESGTAVQRVLGRAPPPENMPVLGEHVGESPNLYYPPALRVDAPVVWIPDDSCCAGVAESLVRELNDSGIPASTDGAVLDERFRIHVVSMPPRTGFQATVEGGR